MKLLPAAALLLAFATPTLAQDHSGHQMPAEAASPVTEASAGYKAAMDKMMATMMNEKPTNDADIDFVRGMIPHHQAAIDMAKVQLQFGKDPEIRKLSEEVIAAQEREIKAMEEWLRRKGG